MVHVFLALNDNFFFQIAHGKEEYGLAYLYHFTLEISIISLLFRVA